MEDILVYIQSFFDEFSWENFHWLRPKILWITIVWLVLGLWQLWAQADPKLWKDRIPKSLQPYVITPSKKAAVIFPVFWFVLTASLFTLAAAGPTWKKVEKPGVVSNARLLINLDLSRSMDVSDLQPHRYERALLKIRDLMDQPLGVPVGLMAYAETPHWVLPFTTDYSLITYTSEVLSPKIMPVQGSNGQRALAMADSILQSAEAPSTLLWITDGVESEDLGFLKQFISSTQHTLELLIVATPKGGKLFNGQVHAPDFAALEILAQSPRIHLNRLTLDESDVSAIAQRVFATRNFVNSPEESEDQWEDAGYALIFVLALFFLVFFRKGMVITWGLLPLFLWGCNVDGPRADWWYEPDYIASQAYAEGDYERTLEYAQDPQLRASAYFKLGDYEAAASLYEDDSSATGRQNLSLALMALGDFDAANEVIATLDSSQQNLMKSAMTKFPMTFGIDSITKGSKAPDLEKKDGEPLEERRAKGEDEELTSDTEVDELPQDGKRVTDEIETGMRKAEEMDFPPEGEQQDAKPMDAKNILMKKSVADPSDFLRKRYRYQQKRDFPKAKSKKPW